MGATRRGDNGMFNLENPTWVCKSGFDFQTRNIFRVSKSNPDF
jgi:hypothetical protein